jgi:hypothetical protein
VIAYAAWEFWPGLLVELAADAVDHAGRLWHGHRVRAGAGAASSAGSRIYARALSADDRLQLDPQGGGGADPGALVRHGLGAGDADRVPDLLLPIVVNVATGLATIEPEMEDVLRALGAKKLDIMTKVGIPRSMPYFFGSLKVAITLAFIGSVLSETVAANSGVGHMMLTAQANFEVPLVFACLIALAIEGIGMYA